MRNIVFIIFMLVLSAAIIITVLLQESASEGLGRAAFVPSNGSYYAKNRGRSREAVLKKVTVILCIFFLAGAAVMASLGI